MECNRSVEAGARPCDTSIHSSVMYSTCHLIIIGSGIVHEDKGQSTEPHPMVEFSTLNLEGGREGGREKARVGGRREGEAREGGWEGEG